MRKIGRAGIPLIACVLLGAAGDAWAENFGNIEVHGYGTQTYMQSTANQYLGADTRGTWDNNFLGIVTAVTLNDRTKLWAQLETSSTDATRFTWFFVDYQISDALEAHAGRVKFPLGIYNEIIDAKFLQVSSLQPALYQEAADFVHDSYTGVGFDYNQSLGGAGELIWQAYGGNNYDTHPPANSVDRRAYGGRLTYRTPVDGLRFLISGYRTEVELLPDEGLVKEDRWIASIDFVRGDWNLKSEYGSRRFRGVSSDAYYVQAARTFASRWTPFVRYDSVTTDRALGQSDSYFQKIMVIGLDYRLNSNISLRAENHFNHGYALPVASGEVRSDAGAPSWSLFVIGLHFIF
jgi:hypothetical protein